MSKIGLKRILLAVPSGEVVGTNQANTFLQLQTFANHILLNNGIALRGYLLDGVTIASELRINPSNNLELGSSSNIIGTNIYAGNASIALQITNTNQITQTKLAQTGVAEILHKWLISDAPGGSGYIQLENDSTVDAQFIPVLETLQAFTSGQPGFIIRAYHGSDSAANPPVIVLDSRFIGDVTLTTRHLLVIRNNGSDRFLVKQDGGILHTIIDPGSNPEFYKAQIIGNATAYFKLMDADPNTSFFGPWLFAYNNNTSAFPALHIYAQILNTADTGTTQPIMVVDSRLNTGAAAVRPLMVFRNFGTEYWRSLPSGSITHTVQASAGVAENLYTWKVSDDSSSALTIDNGSTVDGQFIPIIKMWNAVAAASTGGVFVVQILNTQDTGSNTVMALRAQLSTNASVAVRPIFDFQNFATSVLRILATGQVNQTIIAQTGVAEILHKWSVSDDGNAFIQFENGSASDAVFRPYIRINNTGTSATLIIPEVTAANDSGANALFQVDGRRTGGVSIVTRPIFAISNNLSALATFSLTKLTIKDPYDLEFGTATGTKIGTATTQKLAFWNATPIVQPAANPDTSGATLAALETEVNEIKATLRALGLMAP